VILPNPTEGWFFNRRQIIDLNQSAGVQTVAVANQVTSSTLPAAFTVPNFSILKSEAFRLTGSWCNCLSVSASDIHLQCVGICIFLIDDNTFTLKQYPGSYAGDVLGSAAGANVIVKDPSLILPSDYLQEGGSGTRYVGGIACDVLNKDAAAAHNFTLWGTIVVEVWSRKPTEMQLHP
jgi:hypothetical protein